MRSPARGLISRRPAREPMAPRPRRRPKRSTRRRARTQRHFAFSRGVAAHHAASTATFAEISLVPQDTNVLHEMVYSPILRSLNEQQCLADYAYATARHMAALGDPCGEQLALMLPPEALDDTIARVVRTGFLMADLAPMEAFFGLFSFGQAAVRLFLSLYAAA